ncbi:MAG: hypothetical protein ACYC1I_07550 [Acidimicrobiales bacterium]
MSDINDSNSEKSQDLRSRLKQFTQPLVDTLDTKLRDQVDHRVDDRVETLLAARLAVIERAIADLDREVRELKERRES